MKNRLLFTFFLIFIFSGFISAKNLIEIPDPNFKNFLIEMPELQDCFIRGKLNTESDGVKNLKKLVIRELHIKDLEGIQYFPHLQYLDCAKNELIQLPTLPAVLSFLDCSNNKLTSLPEFPSSLITLNCNKNQLSTLPKLPIGMVKLACDHNFLSSLPELPQSLLHLCCCGNRSIKLENLPSELVYLHCIGCQLIKLPTLPSKLYELNCKNNLLVDLPLLPSTLVELTCNNNPIKELPNLPPLLKKVILGSNFLISLPAMPTSLTDLVIVENNIKILPPLEFTNLANLVCSSNLIETLPVLPKTIQNIVMDKSVCLSNIPNSTFKIFSNRGENIPPKLCVTNELGEKTHKFKVEYKNILESKLVQSILVGKLDFANPTDSKKDIIIHLVNEDGTIAEKTIIRRDGLFTFTKLKINQTILVQDSTIKITNNSFVNFVDPLLTIYNKDFLKEHYSKLPIYQSPSFEIGVVKNKISSEPISDVILEIRDRNGNLIGERKSNKNGFFKYEKLPTQEYSYHLSKTKQTQPSLVNDDNTVIEVVSHVRSSFDVAESFLENHTIPQKKSNNMYSISGFIKSTLPVEVGLVNYLGVLVESSKTDYKGYFHFEKLYSKEEYYVAINSSSKISYWISGTEPPLFVETPNFTKYDFKKIIPKYEDSLSVVGKLISASNQTVEDVKLVLIDKNGTIFQTLKTGKNGYFTFQKIERKQYDIILEKPSIDYKIESITTYQDPVFEIKNSELVQFNKLMSKESNQLSINGVLRFTDSQKIPEDFTVLLLDENGKVTESTKSNKEGIFHFEKLKPSSYSIVLATKQTNIKASFQVFDMNTTDNLSISNTSDTIKETVSETINSLYYDLNEFDLNEASIKVLLKSIEIIKTKNPTKIELNSYGDASGTIEFNLLLTQKRADKVETFLVKNGVDIKLIQKHAFGKSIQFKSTNDVADSKLNRKTDIVIIISK